MVADVLARNRATPVAEKLSGERFERRVYELNEVGENRKKVRGGGRGYRWQTRIGR